MQDQTVLFVQSGLAFIPSGEASGFVHNPHKINSKIRIFNSLVRFADDVDQTKQRVLKDLASRRWYSR